MDYKHFLKREGRGMPVWLYKILLISLYLASHYMQHLVKQCNMAMVPKDSTCVAGPSRLKPNGQKLSRKTSSNFNSNSCVVGQTLKVITVYSIVEQTLLGITYNHFQLSRCLLQWIHYWMHYLLLVLTFHTFGKLTLRPSRKI